MITYVLQPTYQTFLNTSAESKIARIVDTRVLSPTSQSSLCESANSPLQNKMDLVKILSFRDSLRVAYRLLFNRDWDDDLQKYATELFEAIRIIYPAEWNESWRCDAFLGFAYCLIYEYEKGYEAYKRAYDKVKNPPPRLLIEMASCAICPGDPPLDRLVAIDLVKKALQKEPCIDGIAVLRMLYGAIGEKEQETYWANVFKNDDKRIKSCPLETEFLGDEDVHKQQGIVGLSTIEESSIFYGNDIQWDR